MPSETYRFPGLVANAAGTVTGTTTDTQPVNLFLDHVVVRSTTGCNGRTHAVSARLSGGVTFSFTGQIVDCQDLNVSLGGLLLPAFTPATIVFEVRGYTPGEVVDLEGVLHASLTLAQPGALVRSPAAVSIGAAAQPTTAQPTLLSAGSTSGADELARLVAGVLTMPLVVGTAVTRDVVERLPIVGKDGVFATMRKDVLEMSRGMTGAIAQLANEIKRNNDTRNQ